MLIPCPYCGPRDAGEFTYVGDAAAQRPAHDNTQVDDWCDYLYQRRNPMGEHQDYWQHTQGCRLILRVDRNTLTHAITQAEIAGSWAGEPHSLRASPAGVSPIREAEGNVL